MTERDDDTTETPPGVAAVLSALGREREPPPPAWEDRLVERLRAEGLLAAGPAAMGRDRGDGDGDGDHPEDRASAPARQRGSWRWAAGVALLAGAFAAGRASSPAAAPAPAPDVSAAPRFAFLLVGGEGFDPSPTAESRRVEAYTAWARGLAREGRLVAGEKLAEGGWTVTRDEPAAAVPEDAGAASGRDAAPALSGFFLVSARDEAEALRLAAGSPHVLGGGRIVVRRIVPT